MAATITFVALQESLGNPLLVLGQVTPPQGLDAVVDLFVLILVQSLRLMPARFLLEPPPDPAGHQAEVTQPVYIELLVIKGELFAPALPLVRIPKDLALLPTGGLPDGLEDLILRQILLDVEDGNPLVRHLLSAPYAAPHLRQLLRRLLERGMRAADFIVFALGGGCQEVIECGLLDAHFNNYCRGIWLPRTPGLRCWRPCH